MFAGKTCILHKNHSVYSKTAAYTAELLQNYYKYSTMQKEFKGLYEQNISAGFGDAEKGNAEAGDAQKGNPEAGDAEAGDAETGAITADCKAASAGQRKRKML